VVGRRPEVKSSFQYDSHLTSILVSLARAVYSRASTVLLDDVLSAGGSHLSFQTPTNVWFSSRCSHRSPLVREVY
jgi:hypothetical protein